MQFKYAKIYNANGNLSATWYVHFAYKIEASGPFIRKRLTGDINRIPHFTERMEAAEVLRNLVNWSLENGYDPNATTPNSLHGNTKIIAAINDVMKVKAPGIRPISVKTYNTHLNKFFDYLKLMNLEKIEVADFSPIRVHQYLQFLQKQKYSPVTVNSNMETIANCFKKLLKLKIIPDNPFTVFEKLKEPESDYYNLFTDEELTRIFGNLRTQKPGLLLFGYFIYYAYMRPGSIRMLKAGDFDFVQKRLKIPGVFHKNGKQAEKQLLQPLYDELVQAGIDKLDNEVFVFGSGLKPGPRPCKDDAANKHWKALVIDGMGIDKKMYGLKHTGGSNYLRDNAGNASVVWLQQQMGHSDLSDTQAYIKKKGFVSLDETASKIRTF